MKIPHFILPLLFGISIPSMVNASEPVSSQDCTVYVRGFGREVWDFSPRNLSVTRCELNYVGAGSEAQNEIISNLASRGYRLVGFGLAATAQEEQAVPADFTLTLAAQSGCAFFDIRSLAAGSEEYGQSLGRRVRIALGLIENNSNTLVAYHFEYARRRRAASNLVEAAKEKIPQCIRSSR